MSKSLLHIGILSVLLILIRTLDVAGQDELLPGANSDLILNGNGQNDHLRGVGRLIQNFNCTAVFVDAGGDNSAPAYVISNGHCVQDWDANRVFYDQPMEGYKVLFNYFIDQKETHDTVKVLEMAYSTMRGADIAVLKLEATVGDLKKRGIRPFKIAKEGYSESGLITIISAPAGPFKPDSMYVRKIECQLSGKANLVEHIWHFNDLYRSDCLDTYGGGSGSPVFARDDYSEIIGLVNTTTIGGTNPCGFGAPCELTAKGTVVQENTTYIVPVAGCAECFDKKGVFDPTAKYCPLPNNYQLIPLGGGATNSFAVNEQGKKERKRWQVELSGDLSYYRYKIGPVGATNFSDESGFSNVKSLTKAELINEELPKTDGLYALTIQSGDTPNVDASWQSLDQVSVVLLKIDNTPPTDLPTIRQEIEGDSVIVKMNYKSPEHNRFEYEYNLANPSDCEESVSYSKYNWRKPPKFHKEDLPVSLCVKAYDDANNPGKATKIVVSKD